MNNNLAPICLFTYNRLEETIQTVESLRNNFLASESKLFIFSDGSKDNSNHIKVKKVRQYLHKIKGFQSIKIIESKVNKGLAESIITGVSLILKNHERIIVLEDDLITSRNFLKYMNDALIAYSKENRIFSISGYTMNLKSLKSLKNDYYLGYRSSSWGWGTWKNRWLPIDWTVSSYGEFKYDFKRQFHFMRGGSDLPKMLRDQMNNKIDSWAIRWCYHQFKEDKLTIFPKKSKIINIGFNKNATHTKRTKRFHTSLDDGKQIDFEFDKNFELNDPLIKEFKEKFSILSRLRDRL